LSSRPRTISSCFCSPPESVEACCARKWRSLGAEELLHGFLHADRQRHRRNRQRQHAVPQHRIDQQQLEAEPEQQHREQHAEDDRKPERRAGMHRRQHQERRQHHEFALREIDGLRRLPQQREADRDEGVDRPGREARHEQIKQVGHASPSPVRCGRYQCCFANFRSTTVTRERFARHLAPQLTSASAAPA
jgi:hypothetical protein